jgi:hypothetical protein
MTPLAATIRILLRISFGLLLAVGAHAESWRFAVIGDTPYSDHERSELPRMLEDIADEHPSFIVHAGDFKDSRMICSDAVFLDRRALFDASRVPLLYVVGDNEWTDCRQLAAGHFEPLERLQKLRELFFAAPRSLGRKTLPVERQAGVYSEHLRWRLGPVLFVSLNVPGPNNNFGHRRHPRQGISGAQSAARRLATAGIRHGAARAGIRHGHRHAGQPGLQAPCRRADPRRLPRPAGGADQRDPRFPGQVLLIHGDTHWQRIDQPLRDPGTHLPLANFTRLETFGYPVLGWVKVIVDSEHPRLFRFEVHPYRRR